jgi:riboflavin synthase
MFTGIVEEVGTIRSVTPFGDGLNFEITAAKVLKDLKVDNSICVNGVCLTVVNRSKRSIMIQAVKETLSKTNLSLLSIGSSVNLERSVTLNDRLGGHLVQGHVDTVGTVTKVTVLQSSWMYHISFPQNIVNT